MTHRLLLISLIFAFLAACSSQPASPPQPVAVSDAAPAASSSSSSAPVPQKPSPTELKIAVLSSKSVYFAFDDFAVKPEYQTLMKQVSDLLNVEPSLGITLQGNADERGSTEYNLALGQKRAESVSKMLKLLGTSDARMEPISFGEEKPRAACHEEKCWAENRRVDFVFVRKP